MRGRNQSRGSQRKPETYSTPAGETRFSRKGGGCHLRNFTPGESRGEAIQQRGQGGAPVLRDRKGNKREVVTKSFDYRAYTMGCEKRTAWDRKEVSFTSGSGATRKIFQRLQRVRGTDIIYQHEKKRKGGRISGGESPYPVWGGG